MTSAVPPVPRQIRNVMTASGKTEPTPNCKIKITSAVPEMIAENRKMTGIRSEDHHSRDFNEPNTNPTYPCKPCAPGIPMIAKANSHFWSYLIALSDTSSDPSDKMRYPHPITPVCCCACCTM